MRYFILALMFCSLGLGLLNFFYQHGRAIDTTLPKIHEEFNPALIRLRNITQLLQYCDSLYGNHSIARTDSLAYANIISHTVRQRFYHGLSTYSFNDNWVLYALQWVHPHSRAIVNENDILKFNQDPVQPTSHCGHDGFKTKGLYL